MTTCILDSILLVSTLSDSLEPILREIVAAPGDPNL